ncbi:mitochondrial hypoxia responsive domain-containing protein [Ophiocordyceps camponoti-floridani]|uniref:Mitochondrial hypoxia responsive domain-containing protein n=1 Tax=Ophiocordyceps camponoti-floridani TaxID=2030778 RepID=A0A8H4QAC3_9HYPO|nr:mitochondrial hypoxia responsive domain-containing protein [Ophiocordyceps camponoti-floridani]
MADRPPPSLPGSLPSSFDDDPDFHNERRLHKIVRKLKEEPLIPLGMGLTIFAFVNAYRAIRRGDSRQANRFFRVRVAAQGFTVLAMVGGGIFYSNDREKTKQLRELQAQRDSEEKRQKWIRELEVRDEEEKALVASLNRKDVPSQPPQPSQPSQPSSGGLLGKMGLWPKTDESKAAVEDTSTGSGESKPKRENPKSSLGAIGEVIASKKREESESKTGSGGKEKP